MMPRSHSGRGAAAVVLLVALLVCSLLNFASAMDVSRPSFGSRASARDTAVHDASNLERFRSGAALSKPKNRAARSSTASAARSTTAAASTTQQTLQPNSSSSSSSSSSSADEYLQGEREAAAKLMNWLVDSSDYTAAVFNERDKLRMVWCGIGMLEQYRSVLKFVPIPLKDRPDLLFGIDYGLKQVWEEVEGRLSTYPRENFYYIRREFKDSAAKCALESKAKSCDPRCRKGAFNTCRRQETKAVIAMRHIFANSKSVLSCSTAADCKSPDCAAPFKIACGSYSVNKCYCVQDVPTDRVVDVCYKGNSGIDEFLEL